MRKTVWYIMVCLLIGFTSCQKKKVANLWFYTHSYGEVKKKHTTLSPTSFLNLNADGTYTKDFGEFEHGTWKENNNELVLQSATNKSILPIKYLEQKELKLITAEKEIASFEARPSSAYMKDADPFSIENNRWRIKATAKETEEQIRERLINHCRFWETYFLWALENRIQYIDVRSTPTPLMMYGNGFSLKPFNELPMKWRGYFYDDENCKMANNLLHEMFNFKQIEWANTDNKYKMFLSAFQQMQQFLQTTN